MAGPVTKVMRLDPCRPDIGALRTAASVISTGQLVAFPTETVYGLGANALDPVAVQRIFEAKGRPANNPLIVHVSSIEMARSLAIDWPAVAQSLADRFWPGPLTLVLQKAAAIPEVVSAGGPTVALRMPANPIALGLIREAGVPLAAPSANRSSQLSPTRAEHVISGLGGRIDLVLDGGPTTAGIESTVVDLTTSPPTLLRPGPISLEQLAAVVGPIRSVPADAEGTLRSPGMLRRHYAPRTPIELFGDRTSLSKRMAQLQQTGLRSASAVIGKSMAASDEVAMPTEAAAYAAALYDVLHRMDERGLDRILIEMPPDTPQWFAVRDRLKRAASFES